jgi:hypothetical protein
MHLVFDNPVTAKAVRERLGRLGKGSDVVPGFGGAFNASGAMHLAF